MKYKNIKKILKQQVENGVQTLWTFDKEEKEFTQIYKSYTDKLKIHTPQQLLDKLEEYEREETQ